MTPPTRTRLESAAREAGSRALKGSGCSMRQERAPKRSQMNHSRPEPNLGVETGVYGLHLRQGDIKIKQATTSSELGGNTATHHSRLLYAILHEFPQ